MRDKKLSLKSLEVKSFVTTINETVNILGGDKRGGSYNDDESDGNLHCIYPTEVNTCGEFCLDTLKKLS